MEPTSPSVPRQLQWQAEAVRQLIGRRSKSPDGLTNQALDQLVKGCQMAMHSAAILASENERLMAANPRQTRKRLRCRSDTATGGILTVEEGASRTGEGDESVHQVVEGEPSQPKERAPRKRRVCTSQEHGKWHKSAPRSESKLVLKCGAPKWDPRSTNAQVMLDQKPSRPPLTESVMPFT
jgi:hypothetical protein